MKCKGSDLSNCIRADVIRDMLNVVEFGRHDSRPTAGLNSHEEHELIFVLQLVFHCSVSCTALFLYFEMYLEYENKDIQQEFRHSLTHGKTANLMQ